MHTTTRVRPSRPALAFIAMALLLLSACADETGTEPAAAFNEADVSFLESMIPHHAQAVEMAELVPDRTPHPDELSELADQLTATQQDEIDTMNALLTDAGQEPVDPDMGHSMSDMEMTDMPGMMQPAEMEELASLDGEAFDRRFLEMMIAHHEGAIEQAQEALADGESSEVAGLAEEIIAAQEAEIAQMRTWQEDWSA